jgi:hypothetical protein
MGKTKLLMEVRKTLERVNTDTIADNGKHAFHLFYGIADIANTAQKLHPWRRILHDLFAVDLHRGAQLGTGGVKGLPQVGMLVYKCVCAFVRAWMCECVSGWVGVIWCRSEYVSACVGVDLSRGAQLGMGGVKGCLQRANVFACVFCDLVCV